MKRFVVSLLVILGSLAVPFSSAVRASDHHDGERDGKGRSLNLTDLYVFREGDQTGNPEDSSNLVLIMNTSPLSLARQEYFFSESARYEFHISRRSSRNDPVTGLDDVILRVEFSEPNAGQQQMTVTAIVDGQEFSDAGVTTPLTSVPILNAISIGGSPLTVFAGLREDPFFFDAAQYSRVRAGLLGRGPAVIFREPVDAVDVATDYNVNSIVVRVPIAFLQGRTAATTFDVWETISIPIRPKGKAKFTQVERLGRPLINQGLVVSNDLLEAFNHIPPSEDLGPQAAPIVAEAEATLAAFGNSAARVQTLRNAFLPDVMRVDTTIATPVSTAAYSRDAVQVGDGPFDVRLVAGRKIEDDVVDITLTIFFNTPRSDNVDYGGLSLNRYKHQLLHGQAVPGGAASFPFLAPPH